MNFKKVIFRYRRDIRSIPRKELIKNLENIRENYLGTLPDIKERFRMEAFSNRGLGELDVRSKLNEYIKKLQKRKLTQKETKMFKGFLETRLKRIVPKNEKSFKKIVKQETAYEWKEYLKIANQQQKPQNTFVDDRVSYYEDLLAKKGYLTHNQQLMYEHFKEFKQLNAAQQIEKAVEQMGLNENDLREFLNSNRNVDLSHVTYDSNGIIEFTIEYDISLPLARLLDYFGYDYAEYGMSGTLVPKR